MTAKELSTISAGFAEFVAESYEDVEDETLDGFAEHLSSFVFVFHPPKESWSARDYQNEWNMWV